MTTFLVTLQYRLRETLEVEAESETEAEQLAKDQMDVPINSELMIVKVRKKATL